MLVPRLLGRLIGRSAALAAALTLVALTIGPVPRAAAAQYFPISGAGSTWSANAINQWIADVTQFGATIQYKATGSSDGRQEFINNQVAFAASDIPFQFHPEDGSQPEKPPPYAYTPVTSGGTVFMYNLHIGGQQVTNLRLSGTNIAKIFTGGITSWNDAAIAADNPGLALPNRKIVPVVRSDGSGSTAQFSLWLISQHPDIWTPYCHRTGRQGCGETSYYPTVSGMVAQAGDLGVTQYVSQSYSDGAIGYVNYSYALNAGFPVAKMLNAAGYYTEPTPKNVAVSLLKADINYQEGSPDYLTQQLGGVYTDTDPRTYPLSSYSYLILPTDKFPPDQGKTLAFFTRYSLCEGQQESESLGYSPLPINLVQAGFKQITKVPQPAGSAPNTDVKQCHNPTITPDGSNALANTDPFPPDCDKQGPTQCTAGTGGAHNKSTAVSGNGNSAVSGNGKSGASPAAGGRTTGPGTGPSSGSRDAAGAATAGGGVTAAGGTTAGSGDCNVDTGGCEGGGPNGATLTGSANATPALLPTQKGWTGTQTLMVLAALLTVGLVLAPGLIHHALSRRAGPLGPRWGP